MSVVFLSFIIIIEETIKKKNFAKMSGSCLKKSTKITAFQRITVYIWNFQKLFQLSKIYVGYS